MKNPLVIITSAILALIVFAPVTNAADITWIYVDDGSGSSEWNTDSNWDLSRVPNAGDDAVIGGVATISSFEGNPSAGKLGIESDGILTVTGGLLNVSNDITVDGELKVLGGKVSSVSGDLNITGTGKVTLNSELSANGINLDALASITIDHTDALLDLHRGNVTGAGAFNFTQGTVSGANFSTSFEQSGGRLEIGRIDPGGKYDLMNIAGNYEVTDSSSVIAFDIGGVKDGDGTAGGNRHDVMYVYDEDPGVLPDVGSVILAEGMTIDANLDTSTFKEPLYVGQIFDIIYSDLGVDVDLDQLVVNANLNGQGGGFIALLTDDGYTLSLMYVPEPSTFLLAGMGMIGGILALRRRRRSA